MKYLIYLLLGMSLVGLGSCSGEDNPGNDTTPPAPPVLIPHRGDVGDPPIEIDEHNVVLTDDNNGIDTVPDGNWIKLSWDPFIDNDLSHLKIYRYSDIDTLAQEIANIPANSYSYLDQGPLNERSWYSYYAELFDASGNSSVSDTVSYAILAKSNLLSPANGAVMPNSGWRFEWEIADDRTGFYRVLVWNEDNELLWSNDLHLGVEDNPLWMTFPVLTPPIDPGTTLRWRVDYFDWDEEHQIYMGSESNERILHIN
ncbi:MAG: hypothetical protein PHU99_03255 [Candidatus Cloacimonetes bacterium]|nr:hypothetical protein [Candidatus Cloacimonadota bacterium]MDD2543655.1 hypothetical protein [Candidatus Cloacimonadota bacterium]MDD2682547.1 hypothetical protein [Candidatus Cloacimonadota bacterium]MDD3096715.1 hypothetical protein [Candidatus Cloacimonadota bacterium]